MIIDRRLVAMCLNYMFTISIYTLIDAFFSIHMEKKGSPIWLIGFVFVLHPLTAFFSSFAVGQSLERLTRKGSMLAGLVLMTIALIIMGAAYYLSLGVFLVLTAFARIISGLGEAMICTSIFAVVASDYQDHSMRILAILELTDAIGSAISPLIGIGLYTIDGYPSVFMMYSSVFVMLFFATYFLVGKEDTHYLPHASTCYSDFATKPPVLMLVIMNLLVWTMFFCTQPIMSLHLRDTQNASMSSILLIYSLFMFSYTIGVTIIVFMPQNLIKSHPINIGAIIMAVGGTLCGPFMIEDSIGLSAFGFCLVGFGMSISYPPMIAAVKEACVIDLNYINDNKLSDSIGALVNASSMLGIVFGAGIGFVLYEDVGFGTVCFIVGVVMMVSFFMYGVYSKQFKRFMVCEWTDDERNVTRFEEEYMYLNDFGPKLH
jgi:MFS family permease